ncbi:MAG TPA: vanadium-dependent haloperoxidase, partial [candidate division Zixibacteria bacterium]|nr:vanadium-dependent haloperoxidase [candidate division Zixibacteria bacterium]
RAFGYAGVALYEALVPGMAGYQSLYGQVNEMPSMPPVGSVASHWPTVANNTLANVLDKLFRDGSSESRSRISNLRRYFNDQYGGALPQKVFALSRARAQAVSSQILRWSDRDGYRELDNCGYTPLSGPGYWEPTAPAYAGALQPCWGQVRPFALSSTPMCDPGPPPAYSEDTSSQFYHEALKVYEAVANLTPEQLDIALFWADNPGQTATPPGHSLSILTQILVIEDAGLELAAESYAKLGMAVADAFISCWWSKFYYHLLRPITFNRRMFDASWLPPVVTPPFPEYTSGHSVQSGAAAATLTALFGDVAFVDHTHDARGMAPRSFSTFYEFADEAAISRLYGGIHFRSAIDLGVEQGKCIGEQINALDFRGAAPLSGRPGGTLGARR